MAQKDIKSDINVEGKIKVSNVPNETGTLVTYNPTSQTISTRTNAEIISDLSLMTIDTNQTVTGQKIFWTIGGNGFNNHALRVQSQDGSNPGMTFYKGAVDIATIQFDGTNFKFRNSTDTLSKYVSALGYKKDGSDNSFFLLGGGDHISASNYPTVVQADEKYVPYTGAITNVNLNGKNISNVGSVDATVFRNGGSSVLVKSFVLHSTTVVSSLGIKLTTPTSSSMMGSFTVTIFGYIGQTISFRVSMYKFQNNWHVPSITWVHGDSSKISNIEFYKEDDSNLHMKVNFVTNFGSYNRTVITDVLAIGGDPLHNPDTYTISLNPDNSAHTLQQTILNSQIVRDTLGDAPKTPIKLSTSDLNTITTPGFYNQIDDANATPARNYPVNLAGTLNVYRSIVNGVIQEYTSHVGITYKRYYNGSAWASWTQLIDSVNGSNSFITSNTNQTGLTGDKTTSGNWTFNQSPIVPVATLPTQAVNFSQISNLANSNHTHTFDSLTSKPTTIAGYGITDGFPRRPTTTNVIDLNTLTLEGVYYSYQWLNQPTQAVASLTVKRYSTDWIRQEYNVMDGSGLTYVRDRTRGTTWGNWKIVANRDWVNSQLASYVTQSSLTSQLGNYATLNGIQTFTNTITFDKSPIIPDATLVPHAVNLGQMTDYVDVNTGSILNQVAANYMSNTHVANSITSANISNWNSAFNFTNSFNTNFPDLIAIENLSGVDGYLRKDGNGQWSLTQSPIGDATSTNAGKVKLFSDTVQSVASNVISTTASRTYGVQVNTTGQMVVNVPWVDTNTAYTAGNGLTLTGTVFSLPVTVSGSGNYISDVVQNVNGITVTKGTLPTYSLPLATTSILGGIKLITDTQNNIAPNAVTTVIERSYAVQLNSLNQALVNVPWTDTVYVHPTTSGNKHIPEGGSANQILRWSSDGTAVWGAENNTTYSAGNGLTLTGTVFSLPVTVSGSGNYIIDVVQNVNGITVTKGTLPIYVTQASLTTQLATKINALDSATGLGFVGGTPDTPYVKHANGTEVTVATSIWCSNNFLTIHSNQNVTGVKSFLFSPIIPNASLPVHPVNLGQLSGILTSGYARLASNQTFTGTNIFTLSPTVPSASQPNDALPLGQADEIVQTRINGKFAEVIYKNSANDLIFDFSSYRGVKIVTITCKGNNFQNIRVEHMPKSVTLKIMNSSQYLNPTIYFNGGTIVTSIGNTTWAEFYRDQDGDIFKNNVNGTNIIQ